MQTLPHFYHIYGLLVIAIWGTSYRLNNWQPLFIQFLRQGPTKKAYLLWKALRLCFRPSQGAMLRDTTYTGKPLCERYWERALNKTFEEKEWKKAYQCAHSRSISSQHQESSYKVILWWYRCPLILHKMFPQGHRQTFEVSGGTGHLLTHLVDLTENLAFLVIYFWYVWQHAVHQGN